MSQISYVNEKTLYTKAKQDSIGIIQNRIYRNRLSLLQGYTTASEIGSIGAIVISKLFIEFASINDYCRTYLEAHNKIASRLTNKNGHQNLMV